MATIKLKRGTSAPTTSNIVDGEIAVDKSSQKLYIRDGSTIKEIGRRDSVPLSGGTMTGNLTAPNLSITSTNWFGFGDYGERITGSNAAGTLTFLTDATTALTLDSSQDATFAGHIELADSKYLKLGADADFIIYHDGTSNYVQAAKQDSDIIFRGNDGGTGTNMLTLDTSAAGKATFTNDVDIEGGQLTLGKANTNSAHINSYELMTFNIDSDNDDTDRLFEWNINGNSGAGTELMRLEESGNLGLGSGTVSLGSTDVALQVGSSSHSTPTIQIRSGTSGTGKLWFGDNSGTDAGRYDGYIQYYHGDGTSGTREMRFGTEGTLALTLDSSQDATFAGNVNATGDVQATGQLRVRNSTTSNTLGVFRAMSDRYADLALVDDEGSVLIRNDEGNLSLRTGGDAHSESASGAGVALTLSTSQNATFAGSATATALTISTSAGKLAFAGDAGNYYIHQKDSTDGILLSGYYGVSLGHQGNKKLQVDSAGVDITGGVKVSTASPKIDIDATSGSPELQFSDGGTDEFSIMYDTGANGLKFIEGGVGTRMFIQDATGSVGIGNTAPGDYSFDTGPELVVGSGSTNAHVTVLSADDGTGYYAFADGTSGTEKYAGLIEYSHVNNSMRFRTGGVDHMRITSGGDVTIGSGNNVGTAGTLDLSVGSTNYTGGLTLWSPSASAHSVSFGDGYTGTDRYRGFLQYSHIDDSLAFGTASAEKARIDSSGRLIVGHTTSVSSGWGTTPAIQIEGTDASNSSLSISRNVDGTYGGYLILARSRGTSKGSNTIVQNNDRIGHIIFAGADGGDRYPLTAMIRSEVNGTPGENDMPGSLLFSTTSDGNQDPTDALIIDASQHVGIGTTTPDQVLDLGSATSGRGITWAGGAGANNYGGIWSEYSSASIIIGAGLKSPYPTTNAGFRVPYTGTYGYAAIELDSWHDDGIKFYVGPDAAVTKDDVINPTERMRIATNGNVGIGTTSPDSTLHLQSGASPTLRIVDTTNDCTLLAYAQDSEAIIGTYSNHNLGLFANSTRAVTIDTALSSTFHGSVFITNDTSGAYGRLEVGGEAGAYIDIKRPSSDDFDMRLQTTGTENFITGKGNYIRIQPTSGSGSGALELFGKLKYYTTDDQVQYWVAYTHIDDTFRFNLNNSGNDEWVLNGDGDVFIRGDLTEQHTSSDIRLKEDISVIPDAVEKVKSLRGVTFKYKENGAAGTGLIAQEVEEVLPEAVYTAPVLKEGEEFLALRYGNTVGLLVEAIKEQQTHIEALTKRIEELEK